jgi:glycosyltransferase involved in cell wall biosynthesis
VHPIPTVSVVIPCYNAERYIVATIETVLAQQHPGIEIIVVDDGSSDRSVELVRATFPQVRVVQQANQGVAAARNHGISLATGEWIAFVDADDIWLPGKLAAQFQQLAANPGCRMNYCAWQVWPSDSPRPAPAYLAELEQKAGECALWDGPSGWVYPDLLLDCVVWTSTVLAHRSLFDEIGNFDTTLRLGEDYDLWLRLSRVTTILRVARPYALYRLHPASITRSRPTENHRATVIGRALAKWGTQSPDGRQADPKAVRRMLAKSWSDFAAAQLGAGDVGHARRGCWQSLRASPAHVPGWKVLVKTYAKSLAGISVKGAP